MIAEDRTAVYSFPGPILSEFVLFSDEVKLSIFWCVRCRFAAVHTSFIVQQFLHESVSRPFLIAVRMCQRYLRKFPLQIKVAATCIIHLCIGLTGSRGHAVECVAYLPAHADGGVRAHAGTRIFYVLPHNAITVQSLVHIMYTSLQH